MRVIQVIKVNACLLNCFPFVPPPSSPLLILLPGLGVGFVEGPELQPL